MPNTTSIFSSLLFNTNQHQTKPSNNDDLCHCKEDNSFITTKTTMSSSRWFPRIRRRSSSSTSSSTVYNSHNDSIIQSSEPSSTSSRRTSTSCESSNMTHEHEDNKQIEEFIRLYDLAVDEIEYAIESQGSIYYDGDFLTATEAVDGCLDHFRDMLQTLNDKDRSYHFQQKWTDTLLTLRSRLDELPSTSTVEVVVGGGYSHYYY